MADWNKIPGDQRPLRAVKSDGTAVEPQPGGTTLASASTYYFDLSALDAALSSIHFSWDASIILTSIAIEDSNLPEVDLHSGTAGHWVKEDPTTAYVALIGAGVTVTNATVAATGGAIGAAMYHLGNDGSKRRRAKVVVAGTGGVMRVQPHYKSRLAAGRR